MLGRLGCAAAGNQDRLVFSVKLGRPVQMIIRAASVPILPEATIFIEAFDRPWIRVTVIEVPEFLGHGSHIGWGSLWLAHRKYPKNGYMCRISRHIYPINLVHASVHHLIQSLYEELQVELRRFLARWEFLEGLELLHE